MGHRLTPGQCSDKCRDLDVHVWDWACLEKNRREKIRQAALRTAEISEGLNERLDGGAFWEDVNEMLEDPEMRDLYERESKSIAATDARLNRNVEDMRADDDGMALRENRDHVADQLLKADEEIARLKELLEIRDKYAVKMSNLAAERGDDLERLVADLEGAKNAARMMRSYFEGSLEEIDSLKADLDRAAQEWTNGPELTVLREEYKRLVRLERLIGGRPGYATFTVKDILRALSGDEDD